MELEHKHGQNAYGLFLGEQTLADVPKISAVFLLVQPVISLHCKSSVSMYTNEIMDIFNKRPNSQINIENQHLGKYRVRYFGLYVELTPQFRIHINRFISPANSSPSLQLMAQSHCKLSFACLKGFNGSGFCIIGLPPSVNTNTYAYVQLLLLGLFLQTAGNGMIPLYSLNVTCKPDHCPRASSTVHLGM